MICGKKGSKRVREEGGCQIKDVQSQGHTDEAEVDVCTSVCGYFSMHF